MLYKAGDVVETAYGVGVIVQPRREPQNDWVVRLWRQPSKSIASSALAYLQEESVSSKGPLCKLAPQDWALTLSGLLVPSTVSVHF
jgi:hypothetical protein